jgi:ubiquinone/menaquinone biosynthesis C-methylase UbiE
VIAVVVASPSGGANFQTYFERSDPMIRLANAEIACDPPVFAGIGECSSRALVELSTPTDVWRANAFGHVMSIQAEFDQWAAAGKDKGMEERHWHTARHALARMPIESGDTVVDLGTGSGYALRALRETRAIGRGIGIDGSMEMVQNASTYTDDERIEHVNGDFHALSLADDSVDHVWSMEAFYYAEEPMEVLEEIRRVLRPGGTFYCAVNFFKESEQTHGWQDHVGVPMQLWSRSEYREAFREAGLHVAEQDTIPDREIEIPDESEFPTEEWERRAEMVDRYRTWGTLLTVGVAP